MHYNFDELIERRGTDSLKYDATQRVFGSQDVLPLWVADMDFRTPDFVVEAIQKRVQHEIYGYTIRPESLYKSVIDWVKRHYNWNIQKEWIVFTPGVVPALNMSIMAYTNPGDKVILQSPVYYPFFWSINLNQRKLVNNQLVHAVDTYKMDLKSLKEQIDADTKLMLLCNPHNPVGRVWKREELLELAEICLERNIIMISDEIHADLILNGHKHIPFSTLGDDVANITATCLAPSKTFNLAGLSTSFMVIPNPDLRKKLEGVIENLHIAGGNIFGFIALEAAYTKGDEWLEQMLRYVEGNIDAMIAFFAERIPRVKVIRPEGTYLVWVDFSGLGMSDQELRRFMIEKAKVGFNYGPDFGPGGEGFERINVACPRSTLMEALERIEKALEGR